MKASKAVALLVILFAVLTVPRNFDSVYGEVMELSGFGLLIVAAIGRIWCSIYISGRKDRELCTEGPYSLSRNPLYFFSFVGVIGFSVALQSLLLVAVSVTVFLLAYRFVILGEEKRLYSLFGESYAAYQRSTPRFFPALRRPACVECQLVKPRIIEKSLMEVIWFMFTIIGIEIIESIHESGHAILWHSPL